MQTVDALTVSVLVDNSSDMLSTVRRILHRSCESLSLPECRI